MKEVRRIKFTGKNLNDIFFLPCVSKIYKKDGKPMEGSLGKALNSKVTEVFKVEK